MQMNLRNHKCNDCMQIIDRRQLQSQKQTDQVLGKDAHTLLAKANVLEKSFSGFETILGSFLQDFGSPWSLSLLHQYN